MSNGLSELQKSVLRAVCDTFVPAIEVRDDPTGFWARSASDLGVPLVLGKEIDTGVPPELRQALLGLLDALGAQGFVGASQQQREAILAEVRRASPEGAQGVGYLEKQTLLINYGLPELPGDPPDYVTYGSPEFLSEPSDPSRLPVGAQNPNWQVLGYPGPATSPPHRPKAIETLVPDGPEMTIEADICVVGSGAGGGAIAARMTERGRRVVVLEMGAQYNASDFYQLELWSYKHLWYRGGVTPTANGTVNLLAGATLGGGTEVNWMNCIRTPDLVRENWVHEFGLEGVDGPQFDLYMDEMEKRMSVTHETAFFNDMNLRMREGCQRLGYLTTQTQINWDPNNFQPYLAGYTGLGDQTGSKQTSRRTYCLDAFRGGARFITHCKAERILVEQGRAAGVEATYADPEGRQAKVIVRAPQVVVACGALESPALLLRSGIGGPAVGKYLRVQPGGAVYGVYKDKQRGWWGSPMTANCEEFTDTGDGFGFYMEIPAFAPGFYASVIPWSSGKEHKELMTKVPYVATFIWFLRDKGHGEVTIDANGESVATYQLDDPVDQKNFRHAMGTAVRIHDAAGAEEIWFEMSDRVIVWTRASGEPLEAFIHRVEQEPIIDGAQPIISAHQLCTCRMGKDPAISVADTRGELYDVQGVWIGDGSACPTSLGANPMETIIALAERTADHMTEASGGMRRPARAGASASGCRDCEPVPAMASSLMRDMAGVMTAPWGMLSATARQDFDAIPDLAVGMFRSMTGLMTAPLGLMMPRRSHDAGCGCARCGGRT